jgi:hypothetical protein
MPQRSMLSGQQLAGMLDHHLGACQLQLWADEAHRGIPGAPGLQLLLGRLHLLSQICTQ